MKRLSFLLLIFIWANASSILFADSVQLVTEMYIYDHDANYRYTYLYNQNQKRLETKYIQSATDWIPLTQTEWWFEDNLCAKHIEREWKNDAWNNSYLIEFEYEGENIKSEIHSNSVLLSKTEFDYSGSLLNQKSGYTYLNSVWILNSRSEYSYSGTGKPTGVHQNIYDTSTGELLQQFLFTYTYNNRDLAEEILWQEKNASGSLINRKLTRYQYLPEKDLIKSQRVRTWDTIASTWENSQKIDYEYDPADNLLGETYQRWESQFWKNDLRYDYHYNNLGQLVQKTTSKNMYQEWRNIFSVNYSNFKNGNPGFMEAQYDFWGGETGELSSTYIPFMFNDEALIKRGKTIELSYLTTGMDVSTSVEFQTYPNPSYGIFYFDTQQFKVQSWTVLDLNGRILKSQT
ncbi:MAG: hypothetical protein LBS07_05210, partial [Prevotellaceae bacterium]|nr:hypothetical protein [Prevotellaceae bacterium]